MLRSEKGWAKGQIYPHLFDDQSGFGTELQWTGTGRSGILRRESGPV